jgi:hypothetical protein
MNFETKFSKVDLGMRNFAYAFNRIRYLGFVFFGHFFAYMTFESLSLKTNTVYYSCYFDFYIVNDH